MAERTIAIGDIHGCARALEVLLEAISPDKSDTVIPLGDVVDRGPDSRQVIEILLALRDSCHLKPVLGNHEEMLLGVLLRNAPPHTWIQCGGTATLDSYGFVGDLSVFPQEHVDFLNSFADSVETATHFFVHANYDSQLPISEQVSRTLRWLSLESKIPPPHFTGKIAVVGHTPDKSGEIFSLRHLKCIDTYCHGGGWLTALDVTTGKVWQASNSGEIRKI
jgi:serine/threonine protein phosphatase 1